MCALAVPSPAAWTSAQDPHFEIYAQASDETARKALAWFEQLRTFFRQNGLLGAGFSDQERAAVRVIGFESQKEYEDYRARPIADAYYVSDGTRDYIVMASLQPKEFAMAAHEYAHYVLHVSGLKLPTALSEGLAEFFSTLRPAAGGYEVGGDLPARSQTLRRATWLPLNALLNFNSDSSLPAARRAAEIFYAESWALTNMLMTAPQYSSRFPDLVTEFNAGSNAVTAFREVYSKSLDEVTKDLEDWSGQRHSTRFVPSEPAESAGVRTAELSGYQARSVLAQLSLISGQLERARSRYEALLREQPDDPEVRAALGNIALRQGDREEALKHWKLALNGSISDAELCFRYAELADDAGQDAPEVRAALEKAVALAPSFDDARYKLALILANAGEYAQAIEQLRAMRVPSGARRYVYWYTMAYALTELNKRDEAKKAAAEAEMAAQTDAERSQARRMAYIATTDLKVQFATDSAGHLQMVTTRVRHGATDWNPFVEPSDRMQRATGNLFEVLCTSGKLTGFRLRTADGPVTLDVPDPLHVLVRNGPNEFFCGRMAEKVVEADYALQGAGLTRNVLRGMSFQ